MRKNDRIFVAGHLGLVGSAILRALEKSGYRNLIVRSRSDLDLTDQTAVRSFFRTERPQYVFLAAAKVGGIWANNTFRADFIYDNLQIQNNIIRSAYDFGAEKLLFLGSSCIYPGRCPQPMKEDHLLTSTLEYTNEPYAMAKIAGLKMCESFNLQYGTNFVSLMPTNLYGTNDNFDLETSHVLPALMRKFHLHKLACEEKWDEVRQDEDRFGALPEDFRDRLSDPERRSQVLVWGTGRPRREFLHVDDLADACLFVMEKVDFKDVAPSEGPVRNTHLNVGVGRDASIGELAELVRKVVGFDGEIVFDETRPDGTFQKLLDVGRLTGLGWQSRIALSEGLASTYGWYLEQTSGGQG